MNSNKSLLRLVENMSKAMSAMNLVVVSIGENQCATLKLTCAVTSSLHDEALIRERIEQAAEAEQPELLAEFKQLRRRQIELFAEAQRSLLDAIARAESALDMLRAQAEEIAMLHNGRGIAS